ncbi:bacitracin ABC transporter ATP-binding protein [Clostridium carboxidivorans P7]|uniref:ABC transporter related protein n=1 Tax=Clostridium carboxidivorans P7 TaxID=536227 RepID=C6PS83_9CLOT|nr:ABC transporter ATP-binding protein [Clostridium carboxidivorans]AKN33409.1 bacitracin ABC transporter ATP-binding protein [Clostridium carboxidivorans P7]EET87880.1 ABC transporter related protein [Clostridium carboxidivorans P7]EFG89211.1 putative bacitracin transport ATP-binding protein BcrA [Clostridium carboxidivorans P7]
MNIIETKNLTKEYNGTLSVNNLNISIEEGQIYGFLGPNGAGKTTSIRMILGLIKPTKGSVSVFGYDQNKKNRTDILKNVGALIENAASYPHLTAYENLKIMSTLTNSSKSDIDEVLKIVRLNDVKNKMVKEFSLGMRQRLGIAMAILRKPKLLILDEPTNGLDPSGIHEIRELIKEIPKLYGSTVLISSHLLSEIDQIATHVGIITKGSLVYQGTIEELRSKGHEKIKIRTDNMNGTINILNQKEIFHNVQDGYIEIGGLNDGKMGQVIEDIVFKGIKVYRIEEEKTSLEDIFLNLTGKENSL